MLEKLKKINRDKKEKNIEKGEKNVNVKFELA